MPTVSAIVPATNGPVTLDACRAALIRADSPPDEIVIVEEPRDANPSEARNLGAKRSTGEILLFVDSDVEVRPDAVARIRAAFTEDPELVALFGSYDDSPSASGVASAFRNLLHHHVHQMAPGPATTFWTGLGAVRKHAFESVGGFDASVEYMEDVDLGMRLHEAGARIVLDPSVQGTHLKHWSVWEMLRTDFARRGVPWVRLLLRQRGSATVLNLGWRHRLSALAALAGTAALVARRPVPALAGAAGLVALNGRFYLLLLRRRGPVEATAGVFLHTLHHLVSIAAVPVAVVQHLLDRDRDNPLRP